MALVPIAVGGGAMRRGTDPAGGGETLVPTGRTLLAPAGQEEENVSGRNPSMAVEANRDGHSRGGNFTTVMQ
jgi:hypothetical protein